MKPSEVVWFFLCSLAAVAAGEPLCTNPAPWPPGAQVTVETGTSASWYFDAQAGEQIAVHAIGRTIAPGRCCGTAYPELAVFGPAGASLGLSALARDPFTETLWARLPREGALQLGPAGRYCLAVSVEGSSPLPAYVRMRRSGDACTVSAMMDSSPGHIRQPLPGSSFVDILTTPGCVPAVNADAPWITPRSQTASPGFQRLVYDYSVNAGPERSANLRVGDLVHTVRQFGGIDPGCPYSLTGSSIAVPVQGGSGSERLTSPWPCRYVIHSNAQWFAVPSETGIASSVPLNWRALPNIGSNGRAATVVAADQQLQVTQAGNAASEDVRFIQLLYWSFFGRWPESSEVEYQLRSGASRLALTTNFFRSEEFAGAGLFAAGLYLGILNREPEYGGWLWQRRTLTERLLTAEQLVSNFLTSEEYRLSFGQPDAAAFVRQLYRQVLGREASPPEVAFHVSGLASGITRAGLARNFLESPEFRRGALPKLYAAMLYFTLLERDGSVQERDGYRSAMAAGKTLESAIADFVNSPELRLRLR